MISTRTGASLFSFFYPSILSSLWCLTQCFAHSRSLISGCSSEWHGPPSALWYGFGSEDPVRLDKGMWGTTRKLGGFWFVLGLWHPSGTSEANMKLESGLRDDPGRPGRHPRKLCGSEHTLKSTLLQTLILPNQSRDTKRNQKGKLAPLGDCLFTFGL